MRQIRKAGSVLFCLCVLILASACSLAPAHTGSGESTAIESTQQRSAATGFAVQTAANKTANSPKQKKPKPQNSQPSLSDVVAPESPGVLLGAPEATSIVLKALADTDREAYVEYGLSQSALNQKTDPARSAKGEVAMFTLTGLTPDTPYFYRVMAQSSQSRSYSEITSGSFHTQRKQGQSFVFDIQADPHRDENSDLTLYRQALAYELADNPDFLIDLGDTFMGEKLGRTQSGVLQRYLDDRAYFSTIGMNVPLFLVNGNHEGESGWMPSGSAQVPQWAVTNRLQYFVNPIPDGFYAGSKPGNGNYYAFTWGDALFVTLDPFWFTTTKAKTDADGWSYTLGRAQYDWLKATLANSSAKYKFVFIHNLVGGCGKDARGGAEAARFFEWGGKNADGSAGFDAKRPGWGLPIHQLLLKYNVDAVFHGHDHLFAYQKLDGVIYQTVPQPSHLSKDASDAGKYSYKEGVFLPSAGHLRVRVSAERVTVEYVSAADGSVIYSYAIG